MTKDDIIKAIGNDGRAIIKFGASWCFKLISYLF